MAGKLLFTLHTLNRRLFNTTLLRRRNFDGHIVSLHQAGFHWLKNMLSFVLIEHYGLPPMTDIRDNSVIGHPRSPPVYNNIPRIVHSHSLPHLLTLKIPGIHFPDYLVLVRDLRTSLISHYERFKRRYKNIGFSEYLRGDIHQKKFFSDIYSRIRFMNEWGNLLQRDDTRLMSLRYEDLQADAERELERVIDFFGIGTIPATVIENAVRENNRQNMAKRQQPEKNTYIVRCGPEMPVDYYFDCENQAFLVDTCRELLRHDFGYHYSYNTSPDIHRNMS